jgi:fibronectin-binding autotransporter adhesin
MRKRRAGLGARRLARIATAALAALAAPAGAAQFQVTNTANSGAGSLRQAILDANASADATNTITFAVPDGSTISLTAALPDVSKDLVLDASAVKNLQVRGQNAAQTFFRVATSSVTAIDVDQENGTVEIGDARTLVYETRADLGVGAKLADTAGATTGGSLVKDGSATLTLTGANTYSGGTTVRQGRLVVDTGSLPGKATVESGGTLEFSQATDATFAGVIDGAGAVAKSGAGNLTFSAIHAYQGGTSVHQGTLTLGPTANLDGTGDLAIDAGATFAYERTGDMVLSGALTGAGTLTKRGGGLLQLTGGGGLTGQARVEQGTLSDESNALAGDVAVSSGATLRFVQASDRSFAGSITGAGDVTKSGAGTLSLTGANSYTGTTTIQQGTLRVTSQSLVGPVTLAGFGAVLSFDQTLPGVFSGSITDTNVGGVRKEGTGTLEYASAGVVNGAWEIVQGRLDVTGSITANAGAAQYGIFVRKGGVLGGTGSLGGNVFVSGTLSPGIALGDTLTADDDVSFQRGSVLEANVAPGNLGDRFHVMGAVDATAPRLRVVLAPGDYSVVSNVDVLQADGGLTGDPFQLSQKFAFLDVTPMQTGTTLSVSVVSNGKDLSDFAFTDNERAVADALLRAQPPSGSGTDLGAIFDQIAVAAPGDLTPFLDGVGGELLAQLATPRLAIGERLNRTLQRRMRDVAWASDEAFWSVDAGAPAPRFADAALPSAPWLAEGAALPAPSLLGAAGPALAYLPRQGGRPGLGVWMDGYAIYGGVDGDAATGSGDVRYHAFGTTLGFDTLLARHAVLGLAAGYAGSDLDVRARAGSADGDTFQGALYAGWVDPRFHLTASGRYAFTQQSTHREITLGSALFRRARAGVDSHDLGARAEAGASVAQILGVGIEPLAAFDYARLRRGDLRERGAASLDLLSDAETLESLLSTAGLRLRGRIILDANTSLVPELRAYWLHEFGDVERVLRARLEGDPTNGTFAVTGAAAPRDSLLVGLGWSASVGPDLQILADYDARVDRSGVQHDAALTFRLRF